MKVGLVGFPGSGKTTVFGALTGQQAELGYSGKGHGKTNLAVVKMSDGQRRKSLSEVIFVDVAAPPGVAGRSFDASAVVAMRDVDALVQVVRGFPSSDGVVADPIGELTDLATEMTVGDLEVLLKRRNRLKKEPEKPGEQELISRLKQHLDRGGMLRDLTLSDADRALLIGYRLLTQKRLAVVYNVTVADLGKPLPTDLSEYLTIHHLPVVPLCGQRLTDGASLSLEEQKSLWAALGYQSSSRVDRT